MHASDRNKATFRRLVAEAPNKGNLDVLDEVLTEDVVFYVPLAPEPVRGRDGVRAMITGARASFPDLRVEIDELIAEDDRVIAIVTAHGTNTGDAPGQPATGKAASWTIVHHLRFVDGRIAEDRQITDRLALMEQLQPA